MSFFFSSFFSLDVLESDVRAAFLPEGKIGNRLPKQNFFRVKTPCQKWRQVFVE